MLACQQGKMKHIMNYDGPGNAHRLPAQASNLTRSRQVRARALHIIDLYSKDALTIAYCGPCVRWTTNKAAPAFIISLTALID